MKSLKVRTIVLLLALAVPAILSSPALAQVDSEPEAIFIITPENPALGVSFLADASQSFDRPNAGPISSYIWNFGDGSAQVSGVTRQHTYNVAGRYTITLTVFDSASPPNSDTATRTVVVSSSTPPPDGENRAPIPGLVVSPLQGTVDDVFTFNASGSRDPDDDPLTYRFTFGDGDSTAFTSTAIVTHKYESAGNYTVRLTVRDDSSAAADTAATVRVLGPTLDNQAPVALIATGPRTGAAPVNLTFDGRISYDPDGLIRNYSWTFFLDDEVYATQNGPVVTQFFDEPGDYSVILEVSDFQDATAVSAEQSITISERGEPVEPPPPAPIPEPEPPPPSYEQRPPSICGIGMLMPMLACLLGMFGARLARRRD